MPAGPSLILTVLLGAALSLLTIGLTIRLVIAGMWRVYPLLLLYLWVDAAERFLFFRLGALHYRLLLTINVAEIVVASLILRNLCHRALSSHPALARFMKNSIFYMVGLCMVVSTLVLLANPPLPDNRNAFLHQAIALQEAAMSGLFVFVVALSSLLVWFPIRVRRNVASIYIGFAVYFGVQGMTLYIVNRWPEATGSMNATQYFAMMIILMGWLVVVDRDGEEAVTISGHRWNPDAFGQLTQQLNTINRNLEGARKRSAI